VPGASPYQAVGAFLVPLERAVACLGTGKIVVSPGGRATTDKTHVWSLNGGDGLVLRGDSAGCRFLASMHYRIIPTDPEKYDIQQGRWRVTTSAYLYEFRAPDNAKLWAMHWHPAGKSHATLSSGQCPRRLLRWPQSAHSPQMVRKTTRTGQRRPTVANYECAGQEGFSGTAHCAKPPPGRFCKAGVRGSIPLVSTSARPADPCPAGS